MLTGSVSAGEATAERQVIVDASRTPPADAVNRPNPPGRTPELPNDPPPIMSMPKRRGAEPAQDWTRGPFTSVQVNVDEFGNNIPGDAANEPSIAIDATDPSRIVIGWRQFDTIESDFRTSGYGYSQDAGQTWTFPGVLEPNVFSSDPVLASDPFGNIYYYALQPDRGPGPWACYMYKTGDGGVTWMPEAYARGGDKAWITVDNTAGLGSGNIYMSWTRWYSCCDPGFFTWSTDGGSTFAPPIEVPASPLHGTLTVDPGGDVFIGARTFDEGADFAVIKATVSWSAGQPTPTFGDPVYVYLDGFLAGGEPNPGGLNGQVWIASDHSGGPTHGNLYLLASVARYSAFDPMDVMFSRSTDGGQTWSDPVRINDDATDNFAYQWFSTLSVAPNGRIDVVWNDTRNTGLPNFSELFYAFSEDGGLTWSANFPVSPVFDSWIGWPQQNKLGDYYHMVSDNEGANLAYAATFNSEQDVYFLRIERDCNNNGIDDDCDVDCGPPGGRCDVTGCGTFADCNANNLPDVCDTFTDCNGNKIRDVCDIAAQTSNDCNFNDLPDECELVGNDCNENSFLDVCDLRFGISPDCNENSVPDECDVDAQSSEDCQPDGVPDECQLSSFVIFPDIGPCSPDANLGATWCEDFESYDVGSIQGINNWQGWGFGDGDPFSAADVSTERNHTPGGTKSLKFEIHDSVRLFEGYDLSASPVWVLRAWAYIPSTMNGTALFIALTDYDGGGAGTAWAVQLEMDPFFGVVFSNETGAGLPLVTDAWAEIRLDINFQADLVTIFYDNQFLTQHPWSILGGSMNLGAIDLFSPFSDGFYFDDLSLFVPLTTDCNANEIPDTCDVADQTSADCTVNDVPDECETVDTGDFDHDGTTSLMDWAAFIECMGGPSLDASPSSPECSQICLDAFDLDDDDDVDLADAVLIEQLLTAE
jgi:hypothetical protein